MKKGVSEHKVLPRWTSRMTEVLSGLLGSLGTQEAGRGVGGVCLAGVERVCTSGAGHSSSRQVYGAGILPR